MAPSIDLPSREPALDGLIRHYSFLDIDVGATTLVRAAPVRAQPFLQLVLDGDYRLRNIDTSRAHSAAPATLMGLCTQRRYNLEIRGRLRLLTVEFQPGAAHALTGIDMATITNTCANAAEIWPGRIDDLLAALRGAGSWGEHVAIADAWFARLPRPTLDDVADAARSIRDAHGDLPQEIAGALSARQFQRRFARQIGVTPRHYARLCRLAGVVELHEAQPELSWTELAHAGGYADQAHLTRDFSEIARANPTRFVPHRFARTPGLFAE